MEEKKLRNKEFFDKDNFDKKVNIELEKNPTHLLNNLYESIDLRQTRIEEEKKQCLNEEELLIVKVNSALQQLNTAERYISFRY